MSRISNSGSPTNVLALVFGLISAFVLFFTLLNPMVSTVLLPVAVLFGLLSCVLFSVGLWSLGAGGVVLMSALALGVVDLGMPSGAFFFLAIKAAMYGGAIVIGLKYFANSSDFSITLGLIFAVYAFYAWITVAFAEHPFDNLHTGFALVGLSFVAISIERFDDAQALKVAGCLGLLIGFGCFISVALYLLNPSVVVAKNVAGEGRVGGVFGSPNSFGAVAAIGALLSIASMFFTRIRVGPLFAPVASLALCLASMFLSDSRTSVLSMLIALTAGVFVLNLRRAFVLVWCLLVIVLILELFGLLSPFVKSFGDALSRDGTGADIRNLTGRTDIWEFSYNAWLKQPLFGYGLGESRQLISEGWSNRGGGTTGSAHNLILESLLNVGLIGTILLFAIVVGGFSSIFRLLASDDRNTKAFLFVSTSLLIFSLIQGISEKSFGGTASMATSALALVIGFLGRAKLKERLMKDSK